MKYITKDVPSARQGDVYILRITKLPDDAKAIKPEENRYILGHSGTSGDHVIKAGENVKHYSSEHELLTYLQVDDSTDGTVLEHLRPFDTHESYCFSEGVYAIINGRESAPEGWRRVAD